MFFRLVCTALVTLYFSFHHVRGELSSEGGSGNEDAASHHVHSSSWGSHAMCFPSSSSCPSRVKTAFKEHHTLLDALHALAPRANDSVIVTVFHSSESELVDVMFTKMNLTSEVMSRWLFVSLDEAGTNFCTDTLQEKFPLVHCAEDPAASLDPVGAPNAGTPEEGIRSRWRVAEVAATVVLEGLHVLLSSPSTFWLTPNLPRVLAALPASDLQMLPLHPDQACTDSSPVGLVSSHFLHIKATPKGQEFAREWISAGATAKEAVTGSIHEIRGMNLAARRILALEAARSEGSSSATTSGETGMRIHMLHPQEFPGDDRMYQRMSSTCHALIYEVPKGMAPTQLGPFISRMRHAQSGCSERTDNSTRPPASPDSESWFAPGCFATDHKGNIISRPANRTRSSGDSGKQERPRPWLESDARRKREEDKFEMARAEQLNYESIQGAENQTWEQGERYMHGKCDPECYVWGTCHEELGRCDCPSKRHGPTCELRKSTFHGPSHAAAHPAFRFQSGADLLTRVQQTERQKAVAKGSEESTCSLDCGGAERGRCLWRGRVRVPTCLCVVGWGGPDCTTRTKTYCMGGCAGRGRCISGFCHCQPGFYGVDCGLRLGANGRSELVPYNYHVNLSSSSSSSSSSESNSSYPSPSQLPKKGHPAPGSVRVYVYELPPEFNVHLYSEGNTIASYAFMDGKFGGSIHGSVYPGGFYVGPNELHLHERFLVSARRTTDPKEADFFFVPTWGQVAKQIGGGPFRTQWNYWEAVQAYISATWPYWGWKGGRDHMWVVMGDHGLCESPRGRGIPPVLAPSIVLSNWGLWTNTSQAGGLRPYLDVGPCFRPGQDIVIPAPLNSGHHNSPFKVGARNAGSWKEGRDQLLYFKGQLQWGGAGKVVLEDGQPMYSHGVRQRLHQAFGNASEYPDVFINRLGASASKAKFCLAPAGLGFGVRVVHSMAEGCIPLIIQDNVTQPFEGDFLPYSLFSVRLPEADIPRVHEILSSYSAERVAAMQRELECAWPYHVWSSVYGAFGSESGHRDAFEALMGTLKRRKTGQEYQERSLCPEESLGLKSTHPVAFSFSGSTNRRACHVYCDANPEGPPRKGCNNLNVNGSEICPQYEWQPSWQPWPSGCALQT